MKKYYVRKSGGSVFGPYSGEQLKKYAGDGRLKPSNAISVDQERWSLAGEVPGLEFVQNGNDFNDEVEALTSQAIVLDQPVPATPIGELQPERRKLPKMAFAIAGGIAATVLLLVVSGSFFAVRSHWNKLESERLLQELVQRRDAIKQLLMEKQEESHAISVTQNDLRERLASENTIVDEYRLYEIERQRDDKLDRVDLSATVFDRPADRIRAELDAAEKRRIRIGKSIEKLKLADEAKKNIRELTSDLDELNIGIEALEKEIEGVRLEIQTLDAQIDALRGNVGSSDTTTPV